MPDSPELLAFIARMVADDPALCAQAQRAVLARRLNVAQNAAAEAKARALTRTETIRASTVAGTSS